MSLQVFDSRPRARKVGLEHDFGIGVERGDRNTAFRRQHRQMIECQLFGLIQSSQAFVFVRHAQTVIEYEHCGHWNVGRHRVARGRDFTLHTKCGIRKIQLQSWEQQFPIIFVPSWETFIALQTSYQPV